MVFEVNLEDDKLQLFLRNVYILGMYLSNSLEDKNDIFKLQLISAIFEEFEYIESHKVEY